MDTSTVNARAIVADSLLALSVDEWVTRCRSKLDFPSAYAASKFERATFARRSNELHLNGAGRRSVLRIMKLGDVEHARRAAKIQEQEFRVGGTRLLGEIEARAVDRR